MYTISFITKAGGSCKNESYSDLDAPKVIETLIEDLTEDAYHNFWYTQDILLSCNDDEFSICKFITMTLQYEDLVYTSIEECDDELSEELMELFFDSEPQVEISENKSRVVLTYENDIKLTYNIDYKFL